MDEPQDLAGLRVLIVLYYYSPYVSGLSAYTRALAESAARRGASVTVLTSRHDDALPAKQNLGGVSVRRVRPAGRIDRGVLLPTLVTHVVRLARCSDVVVPILPLVEAGLIARLVPRTKLRPVSVCDVGANGGRVRRLGAGLLRRSAIAVLDRAPLIAATSLDYASSSPMLRGRLDRVVEVIPPVDERRFRSTGVGELGRTVGFVGRLTAEKGLPLLLAAMTHVRMQHDDVELTIVGEGDAVAGGGLGEVLRQQCAALPWVRLAGHLSEPDLVEFYSRCSVLVLPSDDPLESFGIVQVEAMLCGCPVVASDLPGVRIPVGRTGMGRVFPTGDSDALADAICEVLADRRAFVRPRGDIVGVFDARRSHDSFASFLLGRGVRGLPNAHR